MNDFLTDEQAIAQIVDELIAKKFPDQPESPQLNHLRAVAVKTLDDRIGTAILSNLTASQLDEFEKLLDKEDADESTFKQFFFRTGINIEKITSKTIQKFIADFLGETND